MTAAPTSSSATTGSARPRPHRPPWAGRSEVSGGPRLYRNQGADGFLEVTRKVGLALAVPAMGCNCGDIDEDGFLDIVVGTGWRSSFASLLPIRMFKNVDGRRFEDVTTSSGAGHRRKGQTVSFADIDGDGDLDSYIGTGGAVPGGQAHGLLIRNPGHGRHWLRVRLIGTRTNRAAIGAGLRVELRSADADDATRSTAPSAPAPTSAATGLSSRSG